MIADTLLHRLLNQERLHNLCDLRELPRIGLAQAPCQLLQRRIKNTQSLKLQYWISQQFW